MLWRIGIISLLLSSCTAEHVRIRTLEEGRDWQDRRPILTGPTKGQQRPGLPLKPK
jgi:hypothetical protein